MTEKEMFDATCAMIVKSNTQESYRAIVGALLEDAQCYGAIVVVLLNDAKREAQQALEQNDEWGRSRFEYVSRLIAVLETCYREIDAIEESD